MGDPQSASLPEKPTLEIRLRVLNIQHDVVYTTTDRALAQTFIADVAKAKEENKQSVCMEKHSVFNPSMIVMAWIMDRPLALTLTEKKSPDASKVPGFFSRLFGA